MKSTTTEHAIRLMVSAAWAVLFTFAAMDVNGWVFWLCAADAGMSGVSASLAFYRLMQDDRGFA